MKTLYLYILLAIAIAISFQPVHAQTKPVKIGETMPDFSLSDAQGKIYSLSNYKGKIVVLVFASEKCPWSRGADPSLSKTAQEYEKKGVLFFAIDSNYSTSLEEIKTYAEETGNPYPILKDTENKYADRVGAMRTPELYLVDQQGKLVYHGAYDNRNQPDVPGDTNHLANALDSLLDNKPIVKAEVAAWGCGIKRIPKESENSK